MARGTDLEATLDVLETVSTAFEDRFWSGGSLDDLWKVISTPSKTGWNDAPPFTVFHTPLPAAPNRKVSG